MTRRTLSLLLIASGAPATVGAQQAAARRQDATSHEGSWNVPSWRRATDSPWRRATVHYGRWLTAASAVALTWMGAHEHTRSADAWDELVALCRANNANCSLAADGRYVNALSEEYYQRSLRYDRRARTRLLAGQGALLFTIGLFLLDRNHRDDGPPNIPFPSLDVSGDPQAGRARVGLRFTF